MLFHVGLAVVVAQVDGPAQLADVIDSVEARPKADPLHQLSSKILVHRWYVMMLMLLRHAVCFHREVADSNRFACPPG